MEVQERFCSPYISWRFKSDSVHPPPKTTSSETKFERALKKKNLSQTFSPGFLFLLFFFSQKKKKKLRFEKKFCVLRFAFCVLRFAFCVLGFEKKFCVLRFAFWDLRKVLRFAFCVLRFAFWDCGAS